MRELAARLLVALPAAPADVGVMACLEAGAQLLRMHRPEITDVEAAREIAKVAAKISATVSAAGGLGGGN